MRIVRSYAQRKELTKTTGRTGTHVIPDITWGLVRDLKCILRFLVDSNGTTIASNRGRFRPRRPFEKFDKSPSNKRPRVLGKTISKDKVRCYKCREFRHYRDECPVDDRKPKQDDTNSPKRFEDYTYTYSGPDVQPQMQMSSMHPSLSMGYDQALGVIKDSINAANPLASLNL